MAILALATGYDDLERLNNILIAYDKDGNEDRSSLNVTDSLVIYQKH